MFFEFCWDSYIYLTGAVSVFDGFLFLGRGWGGMGWMVWLMYVWLFRSMNFIFGIGI